MWLNIDFSWNNTHTHTHTHTHTYIYIYIYIYVYIYINLSGRICSSGSILCIDLIDVHINKACDRSRIDQHRHIFGFHIYIYIYIYIATLNINIHTHTHIYIYIYIYVVQPHNTYACRKHNDAMKNERRHTSLEKYTSHFIWKGSKGLLKVLVRERLNRTATYSPPLL